MSKIVYVDMDDVLCDFTGARDAAISKVPEIKFPQSQYGFYESLVPILGAIEAVNLLIESAQYEPYVLTAPSTRNPLCYTEKRIWIEKHFGFEFTEKLIICSNKGLLKGDYLVDDKSEGRGQETFEGRLLQFGGAEYKDWNAILNELGIV